MVRIFPKRIFESESNALRDIHLMSLNELLKKFNVNLEKGLSSAKAKQLLERQGRKSCSLSYFRILKKILAGLVDLYSLVLWLTILLYLFLYKPFGQHDYSYFYHLFNIGLIVICFLVKSLLIGHYEYKWLNLMKSLQKNISQVLVLRDSTWLNIVTSDLVLGDIVKISINQYVPADLRLISVNNLRLDKSMFTG